MLADALVYCRVSSNIMKQICITLVVEGSCPPAIGPTLGARFGLLQAYHSFQKGWLVLWAYGGGQKTQHCQLYYIMVIMFILDPNNVKY